MNLKQLRDPFILIAVALLSSCGSEPTTSEYLERANDHLDNGRTSAAIIETRNAVKGDQDNAQARLLLGELLLHAGDPVNAEKELQKARELGVQDVDTRPMLARSLRLQNKLNELLALSTDGLMSVDAARLLADRSMGWFSSGDLQSAREEAEKALQFDPTSVEAMLALARFDAAENKLGAATDQVKGLLDTATGYSEAWEFLGDLERATNRLDEAVEAYTKALDNSNHLLSARLKRAQINVELQNASDALKDLDDLNGAGVIRPEIQLARGQLKLRDGDLSGAQVHFEEALTMATDYPPAVGNLALNHLLLGNLGQAEQYSKKLMTETDDSSSARRLLAAIYLENGRYALAEDTLLPAITAGTIDPPSIRLLSTALLKQGKYEESVTYMTDFLSITQNNVSDESPELLSPALSKHPSQVLLAETVIDSADSTGLDSTEAAHFLSENEQLFVSATKYLANGDLDKALTSAKTLQSSLSETTAPLNFEGRVHLRAERFAEARMAFESALRIDSSNATALQLLSFLDAQAGDLDAARDYLERLVKSGNPTESALLQLSRLEGQIGDEAAMLKWIQQARSDFPDSAMSAMAMARYHAAENDQASALEIIGGLPTNVRNRPDILQFESAALILEERYSEALPKLERLALQQPDVAQWRYLLAFAKSGNGDHKGALIDLEKTLNLDANHAPAQLAMANADIQRGELENAFSRVEALRDLIPGSPELELVEARYETRKSTPVNGANNDSGINNLTIDSTEAVLAAAKELWAKNERDKAISLLNAWLEANPTDFTARLTLANSYAAQGQTENAIAEYETVLQINAQSLPAEAQLVVLNNLAWYLKEVDSDRAVEYAERAVEAAPDSVAALDTLAMIYLSRNNAQAAKQAFDRAMILGVDDATILYHGAMIESTLGNNDAARSLLQPLVEGGRDFPDAAAAAQLYQELK